jgi:hypothetical protein
MMQIALAVVSWILWLAVSSASFYIFYRFNKPKPNELKPAQWIINIFPAAELIVRINIILSLIGVISSVVMIVI